MKLKIIFLLIYSVNIFGKSVQVRLANDSDLPGLLELDFEVSFEFFKPLYQNYYADFDFGKNPDHFLLEEVRADRKIFADAILYQKQTKLLCAYDQVSKKYAGLLLIDQISKTDLELELLLVNAHYRGQGIGKQLVIAGIKSFKGIKNCYVMPFKFGNDKTLHFYEKLGFKCLGLAPEDKINLYGECFSDLYFNYCLCID